MKKKKSVAKKSKVPKTRNMNSWTESQFWSFIRSSLRSKSRWWKPILECKKLARVPYKGDNKRMKWMYKCAICCDYFPEKMISIDHIKPVGTLKSAADLPLFVENLFCEIENLQCLCDICHNLKTQKDKENVL